MADVPHVNPGVPWAPDAFSFLGTSERTPCADAGQRRRSGRKRGDRRRQGETIMAQTVNWGILSTAKIGREKVIPGMQKGIVSRVLGIASRDQGMAEATAQSLGITRAYGSYEALLADPDIHAIYNPLPNTTCMCPGASGRWKPASMCSAKSRSPSMPRRPARCWPPATGLASSSPRPSWCATHPGGIACARWCARDGSGASAPSRPPSATTWTTPPTSGTTPGSAGGGLMDIGCYAIATARYVFGAEPLRVASLIERDPAMGTDRLTSAVLQFPEGHLTFTCSTQLAPHQRVTIMGHQGADRGADPLQRTDRHALPHPH